MQLNRNVNILTRVIITIPSSTQRDRMYVLAFDVMHDLIVDNTEGSLYYHADYVSPVWRNAVAYTITHQNHIFYK